MELYANNTYMDHASLCRASYTTSPGADFPLRRPVHTLSVVLEDIMSCTALHMFTPPSVTG